MLKYSLDFFRVEPRTNPRTPVTGKRDGQSRLDPQGPDAPPCVGEVTVIPRP